MYMISLSNSQDSHLEAFVVSEAWNVLQDMMFEGQVYDIYSFVCCDSTGKLRPVSSNISIVLTSQTVVLPAPNEVSTIPRHKFEITELSQLYSLTRSYPLDVIPSHAIGNCSYQTMLLNFYVNTVNKMLIFLRTSRCYWSSHGR